MEPSHFCQSCSMPLESHELHGSEKDGSFNPDYCIYCYEYGEFTEPDITLEEMKLLVKAQIEDMKLPADLLDEMVQLSQRLLPGLKRWK